MEDKPKGPDWTRAVAANRSLDDAVAAYERTLRPDQPRPGSTPRPPAADSGSARPTLQAMATLGVPALSHPPIASMPTVKALRPVVVPMPTAGGVRSPGSPGGEIRVPVDAVAAQIRAGIEALRAQESEAGARSYPDPWTGKPRPLYVAGPEGAQHPNLFADEDLRDRIQPHWRAIHAAAAEAAAALSEAQAAHSVAGLFRRMGVSRRRLAAAREAEAEARQALEALEAVWSGESMRRQFEHDRAVADAAFRQALEGVPGGPDLQRRLSALEDERHMVERLAAHGVTSLGARPGETRDQALARALDALPHTAADDATGTMAEAPPAPRIV